MSRTTVAGNCESNADIAAILRGYVDRFELTSPMVKQMMLDAAAEIERLRSLADDMGQTNIMNQIEIERLEAECSEFKRHLIGRRGEIEQLKEALAFATSAHDAQVEDKEHISRTRNAEIERLKAMTAHAAGFLDGMAARIEHCAGDGTTLAQAAQDCRAMAASLHRKWEQP